MSKPRKIKTTKTVPAPKPVPATEWPTYRPTGYCPSVEEDLASLESDAE